MSFQNYSKKERSKMQFLVNFGFETIRKLNRAAASKEIIERSENMFSMPASSPMQSFLQVE